MFMQPPQGRIFSSIQRSLVEHNATCGPWAQGCRRLTPPRSGVQRASPGGRSSLLCAVRCRRSKELRGCSKGEPCGKQAGRRGFLGIPVIGECEGPAGHREQCEERRSGPLAAARAWAAHSWGCGGKQGRRASQGPSLELPEP